MNLLAAKYFTIKSIAKARDKKAYDVIFECEGGIWTNEFQLHMTKEDDVDNIRDKITKKVREMIKNKNEENELQVLIGEKITLNGVKDDTDKKNR